MVSLIFHPACLITFKTFTLKDFLAQLAYLQLNMMSTIHLLVCPHHAFVFKLI